MKQCDTLNGYVYGAPVASPRSRPTVMHLTPKKKRKRNATAAPPRPSRRTRQDNGKCGGDVLAQGKIQQVSRDHNSNTETADDRYRTSCQIHECMRLALNIRSITVIPGGGVYSFLLPCHRLNSPCFNHDWAGTRVK